MTIPADLSPYVDAAVSIRAPGDDNACGFAVAGSNGRTWFVTNGHLAIDPALPAEDTPSVLVTYAHEGSHYVILEKDGRLALGRLETFSTFGVNSTKGDGNGANRERTSHDVAVYELLNPQESRRIAGDIAASGTEIGNAFQVRLQGVVDEISGGTQTYSPDLFDDFRVTPLQIDIPTTPPAPDAGLMASQPRQDGVAVVVGYPPRYNGEKDKPVNDYITVPGRYVRTPQADTGTFTDYELVITPDPALVDSGLPEEPITYNNFSGSLVVEVMPDGSTTPLGIHRARNRLEGTTDAVPFSVVERALYNAETGLSRPLERGEPVADPTRSEFVSPPQSPHIITASAALE